MSGKKIASWSRSDSSGKTVSVSVRVPEKRDDHGCINFRDKRYLVGKLTPEVNIVCDTWGNRLFAVPSSFTNPFIEVALNAYFEGIDKGKEDERTRILQDILGAQQ